MQALRDALPRPLSQIQVDSFRAGGCLFVPALAFWSAPQRTHLLHHLTQVEELAKTNACCMRYLESDGTTLQRIENFVEAVPSVHELLCHGPMLSAMAQLFGEAAILHKDKINYKMPASPGFTPHQDVAANWQRYGQKLHISVLIAIDAATAQNGALQLVRGPFARYGLRLSADHRPLPEDLCATMAWETMCTSPGDLVFFDSFVPHRSGRNCTATPRRACYLTFGRASEGDHRRQYFRDKRREFPPDSERSRNTQYIFRV